LQAVDRLMRQYDDERLALLLEFDPDLPRRVGDCALNHAREQVPREFVPIP
jgi:hypothetical protein